MKLRQCLCRGNVRLLAGLESLQMMGKDAECFRFTSGAIVHRERYRAFQALDVSRRDFFFSLSPFFSSGAVFPW